MTTNKRKKVVKYRGSKTHGGGSMKKRRGAGHRGGKGAAGSGKRADQKKPTIWKGKYFGKFGFKSKKTRSISPINIEYIERNLQNLTLKNLISKENDFFSIDMEKLGFNKLLGTGKITNKYKIKVPYASKKAIEKVKGNGGEVILPKKESKE